MLLECPAGLLDMTFDQLRTLLVVHEKGNALRAARVLGREQSSVQKQLDTLNRNSQVALRGGADRPAGARQGLPVHPHRRDRRGLARTTLDKWLESIHWSRRRLGRMLTVGTTEFTLPIVSRAWKRVSEEFEQREVEFKVAHVRTKDLWSRLETRQVDLICGSIVSTPEGDRRFKEYEVVEYARGRRCC